MIEEVEFKINSIQLTDYIELHSRKDYMYKYVSVALVLQIMKGNIKVAMIRQIGRVTHLKIKSRGLFDKKSVIPLDLKAEIRIIATIT